MSSIIETSRRLFVEHLTLEIDIGVHRHEKRTTQPVVIDLELSIDAPSKEIDDNPENVVRYDDIVVALKDRLAKGHINLIETLADLIFDLCFADERVHAATVRIGKPMALEDAISAAIEIRRERQP